MKKVRINLTDSEKEKAMKFAEQVVDTTDYSDTDQTSRNKVKTDHYCSKLSEQAVYKHYKNLGESITEPDYTIYDKDHKSFTCDLVLNNTKLAIKTQKKSDADRYGLSWVFNLSTRKDPMLKNPKQWIVFTECIDTDGSWDIIIYPPKQVKNIVFKEPFKENLKNKKRVVYAKDIYSE